MTGKHPENIIVGALRFLGFSRWLAGWRCRSGTKYGSSIYLKTLVTNLKELLRVVFLWKENGNRGGIKYGELALAKKKKTYFCVESDSGGFSPRGFSLECNEAFDRISLEILIWTLLCTQFC
jgi:hypothetical protein